ncbi:MAG: GAF and ANTAR domain-containing protein [Marmoricola sp.]
MTGTRTTAKAFGDAAAAMVGEHNVTDVLAQLLADCAELVGAEAVGILVVDATDELSLLSSSSHGASELELLQIQGSTGPCVDSIRSGESVTAVGALELIHRWGDVGRAISEAGFARVDAHPMRWRGRVLGGLNIFRQSPADIDDEITTLAQAFADVATLVVVQSIEIPSDQIAARVHHAIMARAQVEQAKGVLAYVSNIDMAQAYEELRRLAAERGGSLTETAIDVVREQHDGTR